MFVRSLRVLDRAQKGHVLFHFGWMVSACVALGGVMFVSHAWLVQVAATPAIWPPSAQPAWVRGRAGRRTSSSGAASGDRTPSDGADSGSGSRGFESRLPCSRGATPSPEGTRLSCGTGRGAVHRTVMRGV